MARVRQGDDANQSSVGGTCEEHLDGGVASGKRAEKVELFSFGNAEVAKENGQMSTLRAGKALGVRTAALRASRAIAGALDEVLVPPTIAAPSRCSRETGPNQMKCVPMFNSPP